MIRLARRLAAALRERTARPRPLVFDPVDSAELQRWLDERAAAWSCAARYTVSLRNTPDGAAVAEQIRHQLDRELGRGRGRHRLG